MSQRDRLDPASREPLEALLQMFPGGVDAITDIPRRRRVEAELTAALAADRPPNENVTSEDRSVDGPPGAPPVRVRVYRPADGDSAAGDGHRRPGVYVIHGGGMLRGSIETEDVVAARLCEVLDAVVVSVGYRLAPEHPYPAQVDDCFAGLCWMAGHAGELGLDADRLAVYGGSAGGGLALATALMARDLGGPIVRFQMALYPMIDDRNETASSTEITDIGIWDRSANIEAWSLYLGGGQPDAYAAPARALDLSGLPPTFIDVGEMDLFRDEDIAFASRLLQAGVHTELHVYAGAYHASEIVAPDAELSARIWAARLGALARALGGRAS